MEDNKNLVQGTDVEVDVVVDAATEEPTVDSTQTAADSVVPNDANTMKERDMAKVTSRQKVAKVLVQIALYLFLGLMALIVLFPFYWMIISSLKDIEEYVLAVPTMFPKEFHFENYIKAFNTASLGTLFLNTLYVGIVSTVLSLVITVLSAFAFARLEFKGKNILFAALLATMMIPGELFTITNYVTVSKFGWTETYTVLIVPFLVSVFYIYLLRHKFPANSRRTVLRSQGRRYKRPQIFVAHNDPSCITHAYFHYHPQNDGRMEQLHVAVTRCQRLGAQTHYQRFA